MYLVSLNIKMTTLRIMPSVLRIISEEIISGAVICIFYFYIL